MRFQPGTFLLSVAIALVLWGMARGTSSIERSVDIPVVLDGVPGDLVVTSQSVDEVNVRVLGSRAALRNVSPTKLEYRIDVSDTKPGPAVYEVDSSNVDQVLPRGARVVSRSPASIEVVLESRGRKALQVRPDLEGEPAEGFQVVAVEVVPPRVWVTGARSDVLRLTEVVTETIQLTGVQQSIEREASLSLGDHVWPEAEGRVVVRVRVEPIPAEAGSEGAARNET